MAPVIQALIPACEQWCATGRRVWDTHKEPVRNIQVTAIFCFLRNRNLQTVGRGIRRIIKSVRLLTKVAVILNALWLKQ